MQKVILPKVWVDPARIITPLFFLAGPCLGGGGWRLRAFELFKQRLDQFSLVIPDRYEKDHSIRQYAETGPETKFESQTLWERYYLNLAGYIGHGCILFWLPCESKTEPRNDGNPYALDTYGEIGEWRGRMMHDSVHNRVYMTIGAEKDFPGLNQIRKNFAAISSSFSIHDSLETTIDAATTRFVN